MLLGTIAAAALAPLAEWHFELATKDPIILLNAILNIDKYIIIIDYIYFFQLGNG